MGILLVVFGFFFMVICFLNFTDQIISLIHSEAILVWLRGETKNII
jgi:hypothetical protein